MMFSPPVGFTPMGLPPGHPMTAPLIVGDNTQSTPAAPPPMQPDGPDFDRSINYYADYSGCGFWRMIWPEHILNATQKAVIHGTTMMVLDERYYAHTKSVRLQRQATEQQLQFIQVLKDFQKVHHFRILYEIDDIVFHEDIPDYNKFKGAFVDDKIRQSAMRIMQEVDEVTVTCKFMRDYYKDKTGNSKITVIPNYPPKWWIGNFYNPYKINKNYVKNKKKPRILYAASGAHFDVDNRVNQRDDFWHVNNIIAKTVNEFQWVFIGAYPVSLHPLIQQGKIEFHNWQQLYAYPALVESLNVNMMIAPLQDSTFNRAKSDLKHIEACCFGLPAACQDMCTYADAPIKFKTGEEMVDQIRSTLKDESSYMEISKESRAVADGRWLELDENNGMFQELYKYPYKAPERKLINSLAVNK